MSDTQKPTLPESMILAAAKALFDGEEYFEPWEEAMPTTRASFLVSARAALAAALDGCEVRYEARLIKPYITPWHLDGPSWRADQRRIVIIGPAEDVPTEGEPATGDLAGRSEEQTP